MDMTAAYEEGVRDGRPHVEAVYDLIPMGSKYGRQVIDRLRVEEAKWARHGRRARQVIEGTRWLLPRNHIIKVEPTSGGAPVAARREPPPSGGLGPQGRAQAPVGPRLPAAARRFLEEWYLRAIRSWNRAPEGLRPALESQAGRDPGPPPPSFPQESSGGYQ